MKNLFISVSLFSLLTGCSPGERYYVKQLTLPESATIEERVDMASRLIPSPQQLAWQQMEMTAFLHFGINTFTNREWGDGNEDPKLFNPSELDAAQWVKTLKDGGFKMVIITAKHHDGFCLWPTKTTSHSIASSPWKDGKGDVIKELKDACDKYGMKFGVYLSPWDRNASSYGDSPQYNEFFVKQLTELLTNYGEVHEVWFDGACAEGPNGKKQEYDWDRFYKTIMELQPKAVTAIMGDDVRWVGNESGLGRETEWSATALVPGVYSRSKKQNEKLSLNELSKDLGSRKLISEADELFWYPSEVDVSIRPGWFYHADQDSKVKSLSHLVDIYYKSVGYNSVLLLNIPPDQRGLIHENDVARIKELSAYLHETFTDNLLISSPEYWKASANESRIYDLKSGNTVNTILLQEDISKGQRVESFSIEMLVNNKWIKVGEGTTIGYKRLIKIPDTNADKLRITINETRNKANISNVGAYYARPISAQTNEIRLSDIPVSNWSTTNKGNTAKNAIDNNTQTIWRSDKLSAYVADMNSENQITGFVYAPVMEGDKSGTIFKYNFYISTDGESWQRVVENGEFSNIKNNPVSQFVHFEKSYKARFIKLEPLQEIDSENKTSIVELGVLTQ